MTGNCNDRGSFNNVFELKYCKLKFYNFKVTFVKSKIRSWTLCLELNRIFLLVYINI